MPKPNEFEVHTMGGGNMSGNNNIGATPSGQTNFQPNAGGVPLSQATPSSPSARSTANPLGGGVKSDLNKPFAGAPTSGGGMGYNTGKSNIQTMNGNMMEEDLSGTSSNKLLKIFIGIFLGLILVGGAVFGVFFLKDKDSVKPGDSTKKIVEEELGSTTKEPVKPVETEPVVTKPAKARYSDELLNYLLIDTASETVLSDIQSELDIIRVNLPSQNFSEPITFIVTNKLNKPISFSDFSVYADMGVPSDVLLALDDRFEIYAYNDFDSGVRFGFRVDVKNEVALNTALDADAQAISSASLIFFKNFTISPDITVKFNNGSYKDYAVKYLNLNQAETNSVDYVVDGDRWILGTSQKTLRAIVDKLDKEMTSASSSEDVTTTDSSTTSSDATTSSSTTTPTNTTPTN